MGERPTLAHGLVRAFRDRGVQRLFGVPGGGSSLDVIDAAAAEGIDFVLTATETGAALMAAVTGELTDTPGVAITALGPGAASAVNGVAYAALERAPLVLVTDRAGDRSGMASPHQRIDHGALFRPLVKASHRARAAEGMAPIEALLDAAVEIPPGPVHLDLATHEAAGRTTEAPRNDRPGAMPRTDDSALPVARDLLSTAKHPVILAGLYARTAPQGLHRLADAIACPVLTTYKAKGSMTDRDPRLVGPLTGGGAEAEWLHEADLIILYGLDAVELIPGPWTYPAPMVALLPAAGVPCPGDPAATLIGPLADMASRLAEGACRSAWTEGAIDALKTAARERLAVPGPRRDARAVIEAVRAAAPPGTRASVDAGAHMFAAMAYWPAERPYDALKSNGLSTMAYALPAAIAAALHAPTRPVVAFTGDGGLLMGMGELATAARLGCRVVVVVLNDAALSLIDIKQQAQGRTPRGVRYPALDFAAAAAGLGLESWRVQADGDLPDALAAAFAAGGPALVDVAVDPAGYGAQMRALRGGT